MTATNSLLCWRPCWIPAGGRLRVVNLTLDIYFDINNDEDEIQDTTGVDNIFLVKKGYYVLLHLLVPATESIGAKYQNPADDPPTSTSTLSGV